jgi:hypothetical protein
MIGTTLTSICGVRKLSGTMEPWSNFISCEKLNSKPLS